MTYCIPNFKTKKALKEAVAKGYTVTILEPGIGQAPANGVVYLEGPHYPEPHRWYAETTLVNGVITKVK